VANQTSLRAKGVSKVLIFAPDNGAVMHAWAKDQRIEDSKFIDLVGDPACKLTKAFGLHLEDFEVVDKFGGMSCKRFSMLIVDGVIKAVNVAYAIDDPTGSGMLSDLESVLTKKMIDDIDAEAHARIRSSQTLQSIDISQ